VIPRTYFQCPVCESFDVKKFLHREPDGHYLFLCHCGKCNCTGDFFGINEKIKELTSDWLKLPDKK
jgi:hypothetical protein